MFPDGEGIDVDFIMHIQKLFGEWFSLGDPSSGLPYRFPVVTMNISRDDNGNILDQEFLEWVSKVNLDKACFNIYVNDGTKIASCCRLVNDMERMQFRADTFGNGGLNIGSHRVVSINLPRIALKANGDREVFEKELLWALDICRDLLVVHREDILKRRINAGFLKFFNPLKWFDLRSLFSTIGVIGFYEMNMFMGLNILNTGQEFTRYVIDLIEEYAKKVSIETGSSFNVEEIPGESVAPRFAKKDRIIFGEERQPFELYSNQYIPLITEASMPERIELTGKFMDCLSGGGILHLNSKEKITSTAVMKKLIEYSVLHKVSHIAVNYGFGICSEGHTSVVGNSNVCPICGENISEWFTRIIGYFTKTSSWNKVRREYEYERRIFM